MMMDCVSTIGLDQRQEYAELIPEESDVLQGNIRQGENSGHFRSSSAAHCAVLFVWHAVQESGIFAAKPVAGEMKRKV
jgi:hypothetical protein